MKNKNINFYSAKVCPEILEKVIENNYLPLFVVRHIANSKLIGEYSHTAIHLHMLSPTSILFQSLRDGSISFDEFEKKYRNELNQINLSEVYHKIEVMTKICNTSKVILMGYGDDYETSTRKILAEFLSNRMPIIGAIEELTYERI